MRARTARGEGTAAAALRAHARSARPLLLPCAHTWWARTIRSKSFFCKNLATMSGPNVYETPRSFSLQPFASLSGSDQRMSQSRPVSGTSVGRRILLICAVFTRSGERPPWMQKIFSSTTAASGNTLNTSWNCERRRERAASGAEKGSGGNEGGGGSAREGEERARGAEAEAEQEPAAVVASRARRGAKGAKERRSQRRHHHGSRTRRAQQSATGGRWRAARYLLPELD